MLTAPIWPIFTLLTISSALAASAPVPSSVCTPTYTCPSEDWGGFGIGLQYVNSNNLLVCVYPATQDPDLLGKYYCEYSVVNGLLMDDHDKDLCPAQATKQTCTQSRSTVGKVQAYKNMRAERRTATRAIPAYMLARAGLAAVKQKNGPDY
ncbi:hypothetical protein BDZ89DRAFT_1127148 [Hymenopellis radicata]|nr:hypothetical protein BDZ89DRAFT_1127148 [Hymenopellis radicata]